MAALLANGRARMTVKHPKPNNPLNIGDAITITLGAETFSPVKYFTFTVGPISGTTIVMPGESSDEAYLRLSSNLLAMFECEFATKCEQFLDRLRDVVKYAAANKAHR